MPSMRFNVTNPDQPRVMWSINNTMADYASIGQTWSMPRISRIKGSTDPVLIMGGGYDPVCRRRQSQPPQRRWVGASTSSICVPARAWAGSRPTTACLPTSRSSTPTATDTLIASTWSMCEPSCIESISKMLCGWNGRFLPGRYHKNRRDERRHRRHDGTRKVFFAPDVVITRNYSAILFGTGDREKPLIGTTNDRFFLYQRHACRKG